MVGAIEPNSQAMMQNSPASHLRDVLRGQKASKVYGDEIARQQATAPGDGRRGLNEATGAAADRRLSEFGTPTPLSEFRNDLKAMILEHRPDLGGAENGTEIDAILERHIERHMQTGGCLPSGTKSLDKNAAAVIVSLQQEGLIEPNQDTVQLNPQILEALQDLDDGFTGKVTLTFNFSKGDVLFDNITVNSDHATVTVSVDIEDGNIQLGDPKAIESGLKASLKDAKSASESTLKIKLGPINFYVKKADVSLSEKGEIKAAVDSKGIKTAFAVGLLRALGYTSMKQVELPDGQRRMPAISVSQMYEGYIANAKAEQLASAGKQVDEAGPLTSRLNGTLMTMAFDGNLPEAAVWENGSLQPYIDGIDVETLSASTSPQHILMQTGLADSHPRVARLLESLVSQIGPEKVELGWEEGQEPTVQIDIHRLQDGRIDCSTSRITFEPALAVQIGNTTFEVSGIEFVEKGEGAEQKIYAKLSVDYQLSTTGFPRLDGALNAMAGKVATGLFNFVSGFVPLSLSDSVDADAITGEVNLIEGGVDIKLEASNLSGEYRQANLDAEDSIVVVTLDGREEDSIKVQMLVQVAGAGVNPQTENQ